MIIIPIYVTFVIEAFTSTNQKLNGPIVKLYNIVLINYNNYIP